MIPPVYIAQVAFVDLDIKPAAKISSHFKLDQNIVKYACENEELLVKLTEQAQAAAGAWCAAKHTSVELASL